MEEEPKDTPGRGASMISAAFWLRLIHSLGEKLPLPAGVRAYYLSHLGKYVPGKGLTLVMRTTMAAEVGCRPGVAVAPPSAQSSVI